MNLRSIKVVTGLPRSGTSLMMKMLEAGGLGVVQDGIRGADEGNPGGYYECERVKKLDKGDTDWLCSAQGKVVKIVSALLKYIPEGYEYDLIFMRRDMEEILTSQRKLLLHRGKDSEKMDFAVMAGVSERHLKDVLAWLDRRRGVRRIEVEYGELLSDAAPVIAGINAFLGGGLEEKKMIDVIDVNLYRNRRS